MGSCAKAPPLPAFEILDVPDDEISVTFIQRECNYLQALEGEIDTSHFGFLHAGHVDPDDVPEDEPVHYTVTNRAPEYHIADTALGHAVRSLPRGRPGLNYWRFANFLFPFWSQAPNGEFGSHVHARALGARSTTANTMFCFLRWKAGVSAMTQPQPAFKEAKPIGGTGRGKQIPAEHEQIGSAVWRLAANPSNDWGIDRDAQRKQHDLQRNRRHPPAGSGNHREHWGRSPTTPPSISRHRIQMITRTRRRLLMAAARCATTRVMRRCRGRRGVPWSA